MSSKIREFGNEIAFAAITAAYIGFAVASTNTQLHRAEKSVTNYAVECGYDVDSNRQLDSDEFGKLAKDVYGESVIRLPDGRPIFWDKNERPVVTNSDLYDVLPDPRYGCLTRK